MPKIRLKKCARIELEIIEIEKTPLCVEKKDDAAQLHEVNTQSADQKFEEEVIEDLFGW